MNLCRFRIGRTAVLVVLGLAAFPVSAAEGIKIPEIKKQSYTVLKITRYDGTVTYEVIKSKEMAIRAKEIYAEYPIWKEAHYRARAQWAEWFAEKIPENAGRAWILPKPKPPKFSSLGAFVDEFDAAEKVQKLMRVENAKMARIKKQLRRNARYSRKAVAFLSNREENQKLVRALIGEVHESMLARDRRVISQMSEKKKKTIWNLAHINQQKAERRLREKTVDENKNRVEPDVVDLYNALQGAIESILKRYKINERQWYMVWEAGYMHSWPIPKLKEEEKIKIVAAEVDKEPAVEEDAGDKPEAAGQALKDLEAATGLEDLGDVRLETPKKKDDEKAKDSEDKEEETEKPERPKPQPRRDWW